jgi:hypothetical protein
MQAGPPLPEKVSAIHDLPAVESLRGRFPSGFLLKEGFAAYAQREKFRFLQSITPDRGAVAMPIERTMPLGHGPEESVKEIESDAEVRIHMTIGVHGSVMDVVQPSGSEEPGSK